MIHQKINSKTTHYSGIVYNNTSFNAHFHNSFELIYVMEGVTDLIVGGGKVRLKQDELLLILPCVVHEIHKTENTKYFIAIITPDYIMDFSEAHKNEIAIRFCMDEPACRYIKDNLIKNQAFNTYRLKSCLYLLLSFAENGTTILPHQNYDTSFAYTVNSYLTEHFTEMLLRKELAQVMGYEEHYFSFLFNKTFGMGLRQYLNVLRISYACQLLRTTNYTVLSVALECGFSCIRTFNTVFYERMGQTPSEYRNTYNASQS